MWWLQWGLLLEAGEAVSHLMGDPGVSCRIFTAVHGMEKLHISEKMMCLYLCLTLPKPWLVMLQVRLTDRWGRNTWGFYFCYTPGLLLFLFFLKQELLEVCSFFMCSSGCVVQFHRVWLWSGRSVPERWGGNFHLENLRHILMLTRVI